MLPERDRIRMQHMRDHASEALAFTKGLDRSALDKDRKLALALVRLLEVVGEAANKVTLETRLAHPSIPWAQIIGLRNRLAHGYDSVDLGILWVVISKELGEVIKSLDEAL